MPRTDSIIAHTDEITLKGRNRAIFERLLLRNIRARLDRIADFSYRTKKGTVIIQAPNGADGGVMAAASTSLSTVFGLSHFSVASRHENDIETICAAAAEALNGKSGTFRVTTRRSDKAFPVVSMEVSRRAGAAILAMHPELRVDLSHPETTLMAEIHPHGSYIATSRTEGAGGLPTDSSGKVAVMLSGGIDSPVAAWKAMRRGCRAVFVHFHSYPHTGRESMEKVRRLAGILDRFQLGSRLYMVPFAELQRRVLASTSPHTRVILYRRFMMRITNAIAAREGALAVVTGDSIAQVASQTLENLRTVTDASALPVFRPLIGEDKRSIVAIARQIGTYETSIEPHDDCCSVFTPERPELRSTPAQAAAEETKVDTASLVDDALSRMRSEEVTSGVKGATVDVRE